MEVTFKITLVKYMRYTYNKYHSNHAISKAKLHLDARVVRWPQYIPACDGIQQNWISCRLSACIWFSILLFNTILLDCGSFCRTCNAQRESVYVDFFSCCWLFWQCPIAISIAFSSANMEPTLLVILACLATNPSMHTIYWNFTV